jgi:hypothetical protein
MINTNVCSSIKQKKKKGNPFVHELHKQKNNRRQYKKKAEKKNMGRKPVIGYFE